MNYLYDRARCVGGARCIRANLASLEPILVDAHEHSSTHRMLARIMLTVSGGGNNHALGPSGQVPGGILVLGVEAGRLNDHIDVLLAPGQELDLFNLQEVDL